MGMVFCRGCGKEIHDSAPSCPQCGAPQKDKTSDVIPDGVKDWSWGAFLLSGFWAIGNKTWIGLLGFVPSIGFIMAFVLGAKGREWAWKNNQWDSLEHFNKVQKRWSFWGVAITLLALAIAVAITTYKGHQRNTQEGVAAKESEIERKSGEDRNFEGVK